MLENTKGKRVYGFEKIEYEPLSSPLIHSRRGDRLVIVIENEPTIAIDTTTTGAEIKILKSISAPGGMTVESEIVETLRGPEINVGYLNYFNRPQFREIKPGQWELTVGKVKIYGDDYEFAKVADLINYHLINYHLRSEGGVESD